MLKYHFQFKFQQKPLTFINFFGNNTSLSSGINCKILFGWKYFLCKKNSTMQTKSFNYRYQIIRIEYNTNNFNGCFCFGHPRALLSHRHTSSIFLHFSEQFFFFFFNIYLRMETALQSQCSEIHLKILTSQSTIYKVPPIILQN